MKYVFDIDGTICLTEKSDYKNSKPLDERIKLINKLYNEGNVIILCTARGMGRFDDDQNMAINKFYNLTKSQLDSWGVKYHKLFLGKPSGDIYIDDKGISDFDFFKDNKQVE